MLMRPYLTSVGHGTRVANSATLTIFGDMVDPDVVTQALGLPPSQALRKGQLELVMPSGRIAQRSSPAKYGLWKHWFGDERRTLPLDEQLVLWASVLAEHSATIQGFRRQGWTVELNCCAVADTANVNIPAGLQAIFGELGIDLDITFYRSHHSRYKKRHATQRAPL